jgi:hypothetical protein
LTLTISSISGYQIDPAAGAATITIASSTVVLPVVQVAATTVDATEQGTVPGVFTFTRSGGVTNLPLRVSYHVSGTATTGSTNSARDYVALPGYVDFAAGKTSTNVLVSPINDTEQEMVETVIVTLATGDYQVGANNAATVYIDDNEATDYSGELVRHGVHGGSYNKPLYVRVTRLGSAISAATLNWSLTYTYASNIMSNPSIGGDASGGQVYFAPHKSVANVTFSANWSSHPDSTYQALLKINNNDIIFTAASFHPQSEVVRMESLGSPATTIMEGNTTSALKFTRPFPGSRSFVAFFSAQGSAVPGTDYTAFLGTVNFPAGNGGPYYVSVQAASNPQTNGWRTGVATLDVNTSQVGDAGYDRSFFRIQDPQNTNPLLDTDIDGDGLSDGWELDNLADGFDPITGDDPYKDTDKDGLGAIEEMQLGTDPDVSDAQPSYPSEDTDDYMPLRFVLGAGGKLAFKGQYCAACHQAGLRVGSNVRLSPMTSWEHSSNVDPIIRLLRGTNYTMGLMDSPYSRVLKTSETNSTILKYTASYTAQVFNGTNLYTFVTDTNGLLGTNRAMVKEAIPRSGTLFIPDMIIAADVDRDGIVNPSNRTDRTSANGPFVFWVNDDVDWGDGNTAEDWDPSAPTNTINGANSVIDGIRDLEDFARLHFRVEGLSGNFLTNAGVQTRIYLTNLVGTPSLRLFRTAEANGGAAYLTNYTTAFDQLPKTVIGVVTNGTALTLTGTNWLSAGSNRFFLPTIFEGISTGRCVVVFAIASNTGPDVAYSRPFYLDLRKATDLYEHWTVGDSNKINYPPDKIPRRAVRASDSGTFVAPQANEELDYILFVHGWRMQPWERRAFASTAYKRLYWLGYKGRFGMFSWPTDWTNIVTILHWTVPNPNDPQNFDRSERRAYNSGLGLEGVLIDLNRTYPNRVRVMAHSMGNVVVSEALRLKGLNPNRPPVVHSFVASQAAMAAHAYDAVNPATLETDASTDTPEVYARHPITGLPYFTKMTNAVRFDTIRGTRNIWNYHNSIDFALDGWLFNQDTKPDVHWEYEKTAKEWRRKANNAEGFALLDPKFTIQMYEIYAHIAEARSKALGADGATRGQVGNAVNLNVAPFLYGDQDHEHSAQFRSVNMLRSTYWRQLLSDCGIQ